MNRPKIVAYFIAFYAIAVFLFGLNYPKIINKLTPLPQQSSSSQSNPYNQSNQNSQLQFISSLLIGLIGLGSVSLFENWLTDEAMRKVEKDNKNEQKKFQEQFIQTFREKYSDHLESIKLTLESLKCQKELELIEKIGEETESFSNQWAVAQEIVKYLDIRKNRQKLRDKAVAKAMQENPEFETKYRKEFRQDIINCLNWLYDRLKEFIPREWNDEDKFELTHALRAGVSSIKPYKDAIDFICTVDNLKTLDPLETDVVKIYLKKLNYEYDKWYKEYKQ